MNTQFKQRFVSTLVVGLGAMFAESATAVPITYSATGSNAASIQGTVDVFRSLFGPDNGDVAGSQPTGRREIDWDFGPAQSTETYPSLAGDFTIYGALLSTPGTGLFIFPTTAPTFSSPKLLHPLGSDALNVFLTVPGSIEQAATFGFGAVFSDVDLAATTSLSFFDAANNSLGTYYASAFNNGLSFLGIYFTDPLELIARVRITLGNDEGGAVDSVSLDNLIFGEPNAVGTTQPPTTSVPEPTTLALFGLGLIGFGFVRRRAIS